MHAFARLPESEQVARLARLAERALEAWGLTGARIAPIKYRENAVFRVTSGDGTRRALRVHRADYRSDAHIRSEIAWMRALSRSGIATPAALPTREGDVLCRASDPGVPEPRQCDLFEWVEGQPLGTLEGGVHLGEKALRRTYETVGAIAAQIHDHGARWTPPRGFARPAWDAEALVGDAPAFGRFWELDGLADPQRALLLRSRDLVRQRLRALPPPDRLVHGDLIPDNLLAEAGRVRVIDFDDCGFGWHGFELVTSIFPLLVSGGFEAGRDAFLAGYRRVRPFPEEELALLPTFVMARALSYLGWPAGRPEIAAQRRLVPFLIARCAELAEGYLGSGAATPRP